MRMHLRRCAALVLVDRTLAFRELDDRFRWNGSTRAVLGGAVVLGTALAVVLPALSAHLAPALVTVVGTEPADVVGPLVGILSTGLVAHALLSISGREVREAVWPFDAVILRAAGYSRGDLVAARAGLPVGGSVLLQLWLGLVLVVPFASLVPGSGGSVMVSVYVVAVALAAALRVLGIAVIMRRPLFSARGAALRAVGALLVGFGAPHVVAVVVGDDPLTAVLGTVWVAAGETVIGASTYAVVTGAVLTVGLLAVAALLTARAGEDVDVRAPEPVPWPRLRGPRSVLILLPLRRLLSTSGADSVEGRQLAGWALAAWTFVLGLHLSGVEAPTGVPPGALGAAATMLAAFAAFAAHHPSASLLTHRHARNVLYSAEVPGWWVNAHVMVAGLLTAAPMALAIAGLVAWFTGSWTVLVHASAGLVGAVVCHFVADATMVESRSHSEDRITQTLPQRLLATGLFGGYVTVATGADTWVRDVPGLPAVTLALVGAIAVAALIRPRPWTGE